LKAWAAGYIILELSRDTTEVHDVTCAFCFYRPASAGPLTAGRSFVNTLSSAPSALGDVTYAHFAIPGTDPPNRAGLPFVADIVSVPKPKAYGVGHAIRGLTGPLRFPFSITDRHR
jgi:hypothetical protein